MRSGNIMDFFIAILAGGRSDRFGSNKAIFKIDGIPIISRLLLEIPKLNIKPRSVFISLHDKSQKDEILESIRAHIKIKKTVHSEFILNFTGKSGELKIPLKVLFDKSEDFERNTNNGGRAAIFGFRSIFKAVSKGIVQVLPCDTPYFNAEIMDILISERLKGNPDWEVIVPRWKNGFIEPLNSIYRAEIFFDIIEQNLLRNDLKIRSLFNENSIIKYFEIENNLKDIDPSYKWFKNLNTREDLMQ